MSNFDYAYKSVMDLEGGYSNDPVDRGGETWKGISRVANPNWRGWTVVDSYKSKPNFPQSLQFDDKLESAVKSFYKSNYWDIMGLDKCPDDRIATKLFDIAVNMGPSVAIRFLQRSLNVLNKNKSLYSDVVVDGKFGNGTFTAFVYFFQVVQQSRWVTLFKALNSLQGARYIEIAEKNPSQERFMYGWFTRVSE